MHPSGTVSNAAEVATIGVLTVKSAPISSKPAIALIVAAVVPFL